MADDAADIAQGRWVLDSQCFEGMKVPRNQIPPSYICFEGRRYYHADGIGDARSLAIEESIGGFILDGSSLLTEAGQEWRWFERGLWVVEFGGMESCYERATPETWARALRRQLLVLPGVGKKTAQLLVDSGTPLRFADIRGWDDAQIERLQEQTGLGVRALQAVKAGVDAQRVASFSEPPA